MDESKLERQLGLSGRSYVGAAFLGALIVWLFFHQEVDKRTNEFAAFYGAARLAGTPYLYDPAHVLQEQIKSANLSGDFLLYFVRLPFYAGLLAPLGEVPYELSLKIWQTLCVSAVVAFISLWPRRGLALIACAWSLPLLFTFLLGEDDTFLLPILVLCFRFGEKQPLATGFLMSLLAIKFNLFLLIPVLFLAQQRWRLALGFVTGCALLLAVCFALSGLNWPAEMLAVISSRRILPKEYLMPNFRGAVSSFTSSLWPELILDAIVGAGVYCSVRRSSFAMGMAAVLVGSLLVSHHAGPEDCVILIPVLLAYSAFASQAHSYICLLLLTPIPYYFLVLGGAASLIAQTMIITLFISIFLNRKNRMVEAGPGSLSSNVAKKDRLPLSSR